MSNLKVSHKSGLAITADEHSAHSQSTPHTHQTEEFESRSHARDNTPVRYRELQALGEQARSKLEQGQGKYHAHGKFSRLDGEGPQSQRGGPLNSRSPSRPGEMEVETGRPTSSRATTNLITNRGEHDGYDGRSVAEGKNTGDSRSPSQTPYTLARGPESRFSGEHGNINGRFMEGLRNLRGDSRSENQNGQGKSNDGHWNPKSHQNNSIVQRVAETLENRLNRSDDFNPSRNFKTPHNNHGLESQNNPNRPGDFDSSPGFRTKHDNHGFESRNVPNRPGDSDSSPGFRTKHDNHGFESRNNSNRLVDFDRSPGFKTKHDNHGFESRNNSNRLVDFDRSPGFKTKHDNYGFESRNNSNRPIKLDTPVFDRVANRLSETFENRVRLGEHPARTAARTVSEANDFIRFSDHFSALERTGGEPVRRAYESAVRFLLNDRNSSDRLWLASELLRDVRGGAFFYSRTVDDPFPLTGRARIVSEMIELMRTLDAIDQFTQEFRNSLRAAGGGDSFTLPLGLIGDDEAVQLFQRLLAELGPQLPGTAGRLEIHRLVASLGGTLLDGDGRPFLVSNGTPLKLGELLFLNTLFDSAGRLSFDQFSARLSPMFMHGFDAVYSLIGFDGRSLSLPRFLAIQSQVNGYQFDWVAGEPPLSEGWIRAAIEFLKDSISVEQNVLGESLEEALSGGRFHLAVMHGTIEEGHAVPGSFSFERAYN
jgi:hypothetical protein